MSDRVDMLLDDVRKATMDMYGGPGSMLDRIDRALAAEHAALHAGITKQSVKAAADMGRTDYEARAARALGLRV